MDKEQILKDCKLQMGRIIEEELNLDNSEEVFNKLKLFKAFIVNLKALPISDVVTDANIEENLKEPVIVAGHKFSRQLVGGYIEDLGIYVPETVIRSLNLENGDYIKAKKKAEEPNSFHYELVRKDSEPTDRRMITYALVEQKDNMLVAESRMENGKESIKIDDMLYTFRLNEEDIRHHQLKEGDVVDIAYYPNNINAARICWKHRVDGVEYQTPKKSSVYKEKGDTENSNKEERALEDKHVLVIGWEPRKHLFREKIEQEGGIFSWAEGIEQEERLRSMIKKADVVLILISYVRHRASQLAVDICKKEGIAFSIVQSLGVSSLVDSVLNPTYKPESEVKKEVEEKKVTQEDLLALQQKFQTH